MFHAFGFERLAVVAGDLQLQEPDASGEAERFRRIADRLRPPGDGAAPRVGQDGAEQGVRLELRLLERHGPPASAYAAQPIGIGRSVWRVDLLETVTHPGSLDRAHYHPRFRGWEPSGRSYADDLTADPLGWLAARLAAPGDVLDEAGVDRDEVPPTDLVALGVAGAEIVATVDKVLRRVWSGGLAGAPGALPHPCTRTGWL